MKLALLQGSLVNPKAVVWLEGLGKLKNTETFRYITLCLNQLHYNVPPSYLYYSEYIGM
jgi:hypothetical protein